MKKILMYLAVYFFILVIYAYYDFNTLCNNNTSDCFLNTNKMFKAITAIGTIFTPIIAIIGFNNWRYQEQYKKEQEILNLILDQTKDFFKKWQDMREHGDSNIFADYRTIPQKHYFSSKENLDKFDKEQQKIHDTCEALTELYFLLNKFNLYSNVDTTEIENYLNEVRNITTDSYNDFFDFISHLKHPDLNFKTEAELLIICNKLDRYCDEFMGPVEGAINFSKQIQEYFFKINGAIKNIHTAI